MICAETVTLLKDIILAGAAFTGAGVAIKGLGTWQRQLKGQSEYELSRRILVTLFKYRDAIGSVRNPMIWPNENPTPSADEVEGMNDAKKNSYRISKVYLSRWDKLQIERRALYADLLEAEAIWDNELKDIFKKVFDLEHELSICIRHHLSLLNPDVHEASKDAIRKIDEKRRDIMYGDEDDEDDEFKNDLFDAIKKIEQYLKPKLSHEKV